MKKILAQIGKFTTPTADEEESVYTFVDETTKKINKAIGSARVKAKVTIGGSVGKGTWLTNVHDFDFFLRFKFKTYCGRTDELSDLTEKVLSKTGYPKIKRLHGSRDYFQIHMDNRIVEVIPVLDIENIEDAKNLTDASPLHVGWVKSKTENKKTLQRDLRLAKKFFKAQNVYGAESFIQGFSGHVIEILLSHYGSFNKFVDATKSWEIGTLIDTEKHFKNKDDVLATLSEEKLKSPLIVIDPIDKNRNAAASLREKSFLRIKVACEDFSKNPHERFFNEVRPTPELLKKKILKNQTLLIFEATPEEGKIDVVGSKIKKQYTEILNFFKKEEFIVYESDWYWDKSNTALLWFYVDSKALSKIRTLKGPFTYTSSEHITAFKRKYRRRKVWRQGYNYFAEIPRKYKNISDITKAIKSNKENFGNLKLLK